MTIPLHNGLVHSGDWYIYATGDTNIVTFFAVENEHGFYVAQMGPMPVKAIDVDKGKKEEQASDNSDGECGEKEEDGGEEADGDNKTEKDTTD